MAERAPWQVACALLLATGVAFALAFAIYAPGLGGPALLDDTRIVVPLMEAAGRAEPAPEVSGGGPLGRPLSMLSFRASAGLHGAELAHWKATNVVLHAVNGVVLAALLRLLLLAVGAGPAAATRTAVLAALLWLAHPLHVSTVLYTVQRMTQLATLFTLIGLLSYLYGRSAGGARGRWAIIAAFFVCMPLATLAKETGVLLPLLIAAAELTVHADTPRPRWLVGSFVAGLLVPYALGLAWLWLELDARVLAAYRLRDFTPFERLLSEAWILGLYLRWVVVPRRADLGFYHDDLEPSRSLADPVAAVSVLALGLLAVVAWRARRRHPLAVLGGAWFVLGHALESGPFGLELAFEHRNYFPAIGVVLCLIALARAGERPRLAAAGAVALVVVLAASAHGRAWVWGEEARLYAAMLEARPQSVRARLTAAEWLTVRGRHGDALAVLDGLSHPTLAVHRLRVLCARDGEAGEGHASTLRAQSAAVPSHVRADTLILLARWALDGDCRMDAAPLADALAATGNLPLPSGRRFSARLYGAMLRERGGDLPGALALLERAADNQPADPLPWYLGAEWLAVRGEHGRAATFLARARTRASTDHARMDAAVAELVEAARAQP